MGRPPFGHRYAPPRANDIGADARRQAGPDRAGFPRPATGFADAQHGPADAVAPQEAGRDAHGFRSTFSDWAAERTGCPREVVEMALAHAVENKVEVAYRRGDLFGKQRQLAEAWSRFCAASPEADAGVVPLCKGA